MRHKHPRARLPLLSPLLLLLRVQQIPACSCEAGAYIQGCYYVTEDCSDCGQGQYSPRRNGDTSCTSCGPGKYADQNKQSGCKSCPKGFYAPGNAHTSCVQCDGGKYQTQVGKSSCKPCTSGKYRARNAGANTACADCAKGYFAADAEQVRCDRCAGGTYQTSTGQSSCASCMEGKYRARDANADAACADCEKGYFAALQDSTNCDPCPPGRFVNQKGQITCGQCPQGTYNAGFAATSCKACPIGWTNTNTKAGNVMCYRVPPGSYYDSNGRTVMQCEAGFHCFGLAAGRTPCPSGKYAPSLGFINCLDCLPGTFQNDTGKADCDKCPIGWISTSPGSSRCELLSSDRISGTGRMSSYSVALGWRKACAVRFVDGSNSTVCEQAKCAAGTRGTDPPSSTCELCPAGKTSFEGALECSECDIGKFSSADGARNCTVCDKDGKREYTNKRGSLRCKVCASGQYSDGTRCKETKDLSLPVPSNVRLMQMGNSTYLEDVELGLVSDDKVFAAAVWECDACDVPSVRSMDVRVSLMGDSSMDLQRDESFGRSPNGLNRSANDLAKEYDFLLFRGKPKHKNSLFWIPLRVPMWRQVITAQVRAVGTNTLPGSWSTLTKPWTVAKQCGNHSDDAQFLDNGVMSSSLWSHVPALVDPRIAYSCKACPDGASCNGSVTLRGIVAQKGWWQCPVRVMNPSGDISSATDNATATTPSPEFRRCMYQPACLGRDGDKAYHGSYGDTISAGGTAVSRRVTTLDAHGVTSTKIILVGDVLAFSNVSACAEGYSNPIESNRLCHKCAPGFVHTGYLGKCVACPTGTWSLITPMLWALAAVVFIIGLVGMKIRSSGSAKAAHSVIRRVMIHHMQTLIIVLSMNVDWPTFVWSVTEVVSSVVNTEEHAAAIACLLGTKDGMRDPTSVASSSGGARYFYIQLTMFAILPFFLGGLGFIYWLHIAPSCRCLRCGVKRIRKSSLMDCCRRWAREEVIMVPQPPPIRPSTNSDEGGENRPRITLVDIQAGSNDCEIPVRTKRRGDRGFRVVARDLKRSAEKERMKGKFNLSVDTSASKEPSASLPLWTNKDTEFSGTSANSPHTPVEKTSFGKATPSTRHKMIMGAYFFKSTADCAMASMVMLIYVFQPGIMRMAFSTLECDYVCTGMFLHRDQHEPCWEGSHLAAVLLVAVPTLAAYAVLIPAGSLLFLFRNRDVIFNNRKLVFRYGMMYSGFRQERWWWDGITLLRKFVMILIVTFARSWKRQLHLALGVQVVSLHIQHIGLPYKSDEVGWKLHSVELVSLITLLLMTWVAVFFTVSDCPNNDILCNGLAMLIGISNIVFVAWSLWLGCVFFNRKEKVLEKLKTVAKRAKRAVSVMGSKLGPSQGLKKKKKEKKKKKMASRLGCIPAVPAAKLDDSCHFEMADMSSKDEGASDIEHGGLDVYATTRDEDPEMLSMFVSSQRSDSNCVTEFDNPMRSHLDALSRSSSLSRRARALSESRGPRALERETFGDMLPAGWHSAVDGEDNVYFYSDLGEVQWDMPALPN